ncbi:MAG: hypothetical protein FWE74_02455 [Oscillospiraceae bacterium]|nr:hypothetical protein [Oscillospiraceae bacterium]
MASSIEIRATQKTALYEILMLKKQNDKAGTKVAGLNQLVTKMKVAMEAEDVAYVEKMIAEEVE